MRRLISQRFIANKHLFFYLIYISDCKLSLQSTNKAVINNTSKENKTRDEEDDAKY